MLALYVIIYVFIFHDINTGPTTTQPWSRCILTCTFFWSAGKSIDDQHRYHLRLILAQWWNSSCSRYLSDQTERHGQWRIGSCQSIWDRHIFRINLPTVATSAYTLRAQFNGNLPTRMVCKPKRIEKSIPWNHESSDWGMLRRWRAVCCRKLQCELNGQKYRVCVFRSVSHIRDRFGSSETRIQRENKTRDMLAMFAIVFHVMLRFTPHDDPA